MRLTSVAITLGLVLFAAGSAQAQLNGSFTNSGSGWTGTGPLTNGSPHVTTNDSGTTVCRIGADNGVPGAPGGAVKSTGRNVCTTTVSSYCAVHFHADWTPVGNETAKVRVSYKNSEGTTVISRNITASGDHVVNAKDQCPSLVQVTFSIDSGGKPVNSTLDISGVSIACDLLDWSTLAVQAPPTFGTPITIQGYPVPLAGVPFGSQPTDTIIQRTTGLSPLANPLSSGSNALDKVLPALDGTMFYKYNPQTGLFDRYYHNAGVWNPSGGTFGPGDAAFIYCRVPQQFTFSGKYALMPLAEHPASGSAYFANPVTWPVLLEDVMGFKPVVGDVLLTYRHGDTNSAPPGTIDSTFIFLPDNFAVQPAIEPGETVQVFFADPSKVPLTLRPTASNTSAPPTIIQVSAPGDLPGSGLLETADTLGPSAQWKSLLGVADYYCEPATNPARFFRLGFNLPKGQLFGTITQSNGAPMPGVTVQLDPNGPIQTTAGTGTYSFFDIPIGLIDLNVDTPVQVFDPTTHQVSVVTVGQSLPITLVTPQTVVAITLDIAVAASGQPACDCKPVASAMHAYNAATGEHFVRLIGTSSPNPCPGGAVTVTITDPNGVTKNLGPSGMTYGPPAAKGTYTVSATICGKTQTASVTVP
ncbi:MAG TPA: carboxypeptidase-like regulatory domain-containing protein [Candidatus Binatia bacterium]|nr:carboxypeptidase-like regulatory domain-containing protein [Candidatus Binatia bacterium]